MATLDTTTAAELSGISSPTAGDAYFVTDTGKLAVYNGSAFNITNYDSTYEADFDKIMTHSGELDGVNDQWTIASPAAELDLDTDFTICAWFRRIALSSYAGIINWGENATGKRRGMGIHSSGFMGYYGHGTAYWGSTVMAAGTWYFGAITTSDAEMKVYLNAVVEDTQASPNLTAFTSNDLNIGTLYGTTYNDFNGQISNIGLWDEVLTGAEITKLYNSGKVCNYDTDSGDYTSSDNLVAWWTLNNTLTDSSDNSNTLTAVNNASFIDYPPPGAL